MIINGLAGQQRRSMGQDSGQGTSVELGRKAESTQMGYMVGNPQRSTMIDYVVMDLLCQSEASIKDDRHSRSFNTSQNVFIMLIGSH